MDGCIKRLKSVWRIQPKTVCGQLLSLVWWSATRTLTSKESKFLHNFVHVLFFFSLYTCLNKGKTQVNLFGASASTWSTAAFLGPAAQNLQTHKKVLELPLILVCALKNILTLSWGAVSSICTVSLSLKLCCHVVSLKLSPMFLSAPGWITVMLFTMSVNTVPPAADAECSHQGCIHL